MIGIEDLGFRYSARGDSLFDGLGHVFDAGSVSVVTGPSGCGKSTLLYLLGLLLRPRSGRIVLDGVDAGGLPDVGRSRLRAEQIGFVFQDAALDATRPVIDNVVEGGLYAGMTRRESESKANQLLSMFGVELRGDHRPGEVSGGQAQRVGLCRALIKDPSIILADEPTGNLDAASAAVVYGALTDAAAGGATVVIASHDTTITTGADHVLAL
jgi:putative ABC transport system ATP-binding protein/lipoprotein-releasing system ATP-binding protein